MNPSNITNIFHIASGDLWAGAEVQIYTLTTTLSKDPGVEIHVILFNHGKLEHELTRAGIDVIIIDESKLNGYQIIRLIVKYIRAQKPDIVHTHGLKANILAGFSSLLSGNTLSLRTEHGAQETRTSWLNFTRWSLLFLNHMCGRFLQNKIISVSQDLSSVLAETYPKKKIHVIENGIDIKAIDANTQNSFDKESTDVFKVGLVGRLVPVKRVDLFIQTAKYFLDNSPALKIEFRIFGDGPLRLELEQLSNRLGADEVVRFYGHSDGITDQIRLLDILMITSDHEGLPMVLLEAMTLQTPVIAHATGGMVNVLDNGNCGRLVYEQQASAYAEALHDLAGNMDKRMGLAKTARDRVEKKYSASANASHYLDTYLSIIKLHAKTAQ